MEEQNAELRDDDRGKELEAEEDYIIRLRGELVFSDSDYLEARFSKAPSESNRVRKSRGEEGLGNFIRNDRRLHICKSLFPHDYDVETHEVTGTYSYNVKIRRRSEEELDKIYRSKNIVEGY